ncbi:MAG: hypothetical protein B6U95_00385 [Thermofilum sp. ex4484_82]|nr:MAG: hypothetical protein B6U95_00385 [Thermofilum sp. ex4484_82]OYT40073.1 MAG: hypothetical protein B6U96_00390 [Archaeoglobales archaeon ex4484_92]
MTEEEFIQLHIPTGVGLKGAIGWKFVVPKISHPVFLATYQALITYIVKSVGEDPEKINREIKEAGRTIGTFIYSEYLMTAKGVVSKNPEDFARLYNLGFKVLTGKPFDRVSAFRSKDGKKFKIIWEITECPLCHKLASPVKGVKICNIFSGVVEAIEIPRLPEWGASKIQVDEVECRADGDEKCKWVLIIEY